MYEIIVLLLIFILSLILIFKNKDLAIFVLLLLSVFLHKEVFSFYKWDLLPVRVFMLALCVYSSIRFISFLRKPHKYQKINDFINNPFLLLLFLLWLVKAVSLVYTKNWSASLFLFGFFTTVVILGVFLYYFLYKKEEQILKYIKFYIYTAFALVLFGVVQIVLYLKFNFIIGALWNIPGHVPRVGATFWDVNHYAAFLSFLLPILGAFILLEKRIFKKLFLTVMFGGMTAGLILTSSRTGWIISGVSFISFLMVLLVNKFGRKGMLFLCGILFVGLLFFTKEYSDKTSTFRAYVKQYFHYRLDSFASHIMLLQGSYQIFQQFPIIGSGYGSFFENFRKTPISAAFFSRDPVALTTRVPPHTIWGEALAETGIIGFSFTLLFALLNLSVLLFGALKSKKPNERLILNAMFSTVLGVFVAGIFYSYNVEFFWLIMFLFFYYGISVVFKNYSYRDIYEYFIGWKLFPVFGLLFIGSLLIFINLGTNHLIPWDEAIYAKIAKNMVNKNIYLSQYWKPDLIWYEKPPLYMWMAAFFMKSFGFISLAPRLPSAIFGVLTVLVTYLTSYKLFKSKIAAFLSGLALVTSVHFLYYARASMLDVTTTFFITLSIYFFILAKEKTSKILWLISGISAGLAIMTKGAIGSLSIFIIGAYQIYLLLAGQEKLNLKLLINNLVYLFGVLGIALPWHYLMYLRFGKAFINNYLVYHVYDRATTAIEDKGQPWYWYLIVMKVSMRIWFIPLLAAFPLFLIRAFSNRKSFTLVTIWSLVIFTVFSAAKSKVVWYIIPIYPPVCIMVGYFISKVFHFVSNYLKVLKSIQIKFVLFFFLTLFSLMYLFYNRKLVYTSDLTGAQAQLLMLKDKELGLQDKLYVDRIELPLIMYYTDSPFEVIDYGPANKRAPIQYYNDRLVILAKKGRFAQSNLFYIKQPVIVGEMGDYALWYYPSSLELDKEQLIEIDSQIKDLSENPVLNQSQILSLEQLHSEIADRINRRAN